MNLFFILCDRMTVALNASNLGAYATDTASY